MEPTVAGLALSTLRDADWFIRQTLSPPSPYYVYLPTTGIADAQQLAHHVQTEDNSSRTATTSARLYNTYTTTIIGDYVAIARVSHACLNIPSRWPSRVCLATPERRQSINRENTSPTSLRNRLYWSICRCMHILFISQLRSDRQTGESVRTARACYSFDPTTFDE